MISQNTMCNLWSGSPQIKVKLCFLELQCGVGVLLHPFHVFSTGQFLPQMKTALVINIEYVVQNMETMFQRVNINVMGGCV